ncbi:Similar to Srprb: Signal recognition particle receptor subunit beta (Rattus norvegicus) [Cotesia congregata]|uniref:Signal recognition particle receptor subunit beta n=1 Tax=Cotesia congregata TaxID=51543 RepID=A0A8J2EIT0_COTCN|nr:Similar to Srprb: Signal recognition particle receptor subunit beta (Rattus norvegicus) [Cotesia congregata]
MEDSSELLNETDGFSQFIGIIIAVAVIIFTLVFFTFWQRRKSAKRNILLTGLCEAGKTYLFTRFVQDRCIPTYTSARENIGEIKIKDVNKYKTSAVGIVFIIDSVTIKNDIRDVTEFLYNLLSDSTIQKVPLLILCNKQEQKTAKSSSDIKSLLEKEMDLVRVTKSSQLEATDDTSASSFIGIQGKDFKFDHLNTEIQFDEFYSSNFNKEALQDTFRKIFL